MPEQPPAQVTTDLLGYLSRHAYDEDYETAAQRRRTGRRSRGPVAAVVLIAFGLLLVTAGGQTSREALASSDERKDLIAQINDRTATLHHDQRHIQELEAENRQRARQAQADQNDYRSYAARVRQLAPLVGAVPVHGPGVAVLVDNGPHAATNDREKVLDADLQRLVNGLWQAGAEAIAINGHRLTSLSAIRKAGGAITVNYFSLTPPFRVKAIGDPDTLPGRFAATSAGQAWFDLHQELGLRFEIHSRTALSLPAATTTLHHARPVHRGGSP